jgi:hypothetical protein
MDRKELFKSQATRDFAIALVLIVVTGSWILPDRCFARPGQGAELTRFNITKYGNQIILPVKFKDNEYWFLLDTGSSFTIFDSSFKSELGDVTGKTTIKTPRNEMTADIYNAPEAMLGEINLKSCAGVLCLNLEQTGYADGKKIKGIIGMNFLRKYMLQIDFDADMLYIFDSVQGEKLRWGQSCDMTFPTGGLPHVKGTVFFDIPVEFLVDTGYSSTGSLEEKIFRQILTQKKAKTIETSFVTLGGTIKEQEARINDLSVGDFHYRDLIFSEMDSSILGLEFLARHGVLFDFPNKRLYMEEGRDYRRHDERDMSGLRLVKSYDKTIVHSVEMGSPAEKAGLKAGDVIIMVGHKLANQYDIWILRRDLMAMDGSKVEITFERDGQRKEVPLVLVQKL